MAPERFGDTDALLTPASVVFAWGGVVAYAGTGRTPFAADSPPATAARILTQPPDLKGLSGPLRDLVAHALEKDPANRPSARELLDLLVSGPSRPAAIAEALADQPDLRAAAAEAQAVTGVKAPAVLVGYDENSIVTIPISEMTVPAPAGPPPPEPGRRWFLPVAVALLVLAVVAGAMMVVLGNVRGNPADAVEPIPPAVPSGGPVGVSEQLLIQDDLSRPWYWQAKTQASEKAECSFEDGAMVAQRAEKGLYKCAGPADDVPTDFHAEVGVQLLTTDSCAGIWFRFRPYRGYLVRVCENTIFVGTHKSQGGVTTIRTFPLGRPLVVGAAATEIGLRAVGSELQLERDGAKLGTVPLTDPEISGGRVLLGVYTERGVPQTGPYEVAFSNVRIWGLGKD
jgi:hypothetical protein